LRAVDEGVCRGCSMSAKLTVFLGVVRDRAWLRLRAEERVMSCSWRPERERVERDEAFLEWRGVKNRVKRFGVMGGGRLCLVVVVVVAVVEAAAGGDDEKRSGEGSSWRSWLRAAQGDDMMRAPEGQKAHRSSQEPSGCSHAELDGHRSHPPCNGRGWRARPLAHSRSRSADA